MLKQAVLALHILEFQSADTRADSTAIGDAEDDGDLVRQRCVGQQHGHAVIVRSDVERVLGRQRNVDRRAGRRPLRERGNPGFAAADGIAKRIGEGRGQKRVGMLLLTGQTGDAGLAIALDLIGTEGLDQQLAHFAAEVLAGGDHGLQVIHLPARKRILHDRDDRHLAQRHRLFVAAVDMMLDEAEPFAGLIEELETQGFTFKTIDQLRDDPDRDQKLCDLTNAVSNDVPLGMPSTALSLEQFKKSILEVSWAREPAFCVAIFEGRYVGINNIGVDVNNNAFVDLTGVLPDFRGRGLAQALKRKGIEWALTQGIKKMFTANDLVNAPMLAVNQKFGFILEPVQIRYGKKLSGKT